MSLHREKCLCSSKRSWMTDLGGPSMNTIREESLGRFATRSPQSSRLFQMLSPIPPPKAKGRRTLWLPSLSIRRYLITASLTYVVADTSFLSFVNLR
jgi:hypothetical protein